MVKSQSYDRVILFLLKNKLGNNNKNQSKTSRSQLKKFIQEYFPNKNRTNNKLKKFLSNALINLVDRGDLIKIKESYKLTKQCINKNHRFPLLGCKLGNVSNTPARAYISKEAIKAKKAIYPVKGIPTAKRPFIKATKKTPPKRKE
jgi:hypothetical protein